MHSFLEAPIALQYLFVFFFGAIFGSFANVVIIRLPKDESIILPSSHCIKCNYKIPWFHNIPILSWFVLLGRCANCKIKISFRYPLVETIMAFGFLALYVHHGFNLYFFEHALLFFGLVTVSFIDLDHMIIPDSFSLGGIGIGLLGSYFNEGRGVLSSFLGVLMGGGFLWAVAYLYYVWRKQEGMGGGDIKLLAWIGAVLGWKSIPFVILSSSIIGSIVGLYVSIKSEKGLTAAIPFGPYLALGAILYIFYGDNFVNWYFGIFLPGF